MGASGPTGKAPQESGSGPLSAVDPPWSRRALRGSGVGGRGRQRGRGSRPTGVRTRGVRVEAALSPREVGATGQAIPFPLEGGELCTSKAKL